MPSSWGPRTIQRRREEPSPPIDAVGSEDGDGDGQNKDADGGTGGVEGVHAVPVMSGENAAGSSRLETESRSGADALAASRPIANPKSGSCVDADAPVMVHAFSAPNDCETHVTGSHETAASKSSAGSVRHEAPVSMTAAAM